METINKLAKKGISLIALIVLITVIFIIVSLAVYEGNDLHKNAQVAVFYNNVSIVQEAVTRLMMDNMNKYADDLQKDPKIYKWEGVIDSTLPPNFNSSDNILINNMTPVIQLSKNIANHVEIDKNELAKYYVAENGLVYYYNNGLGFNYDGVTYYNNYITLNTTNTPPSCSITADGVSNNTTTDSSITYRFKWNKNVVDFTIDDIIVTNGTKGTFTEIKPQEEYTLTVTNTGSYIQTIQIPPNICTDNNGINNVGNTINIAIQTNNIYTNLIAIWNGEFDISWYVPNPLAESFSISTKEQLAGFALLTAAAGKGVYYNEYGYANTTGPNLTIGTNFANQTINITEDIIVNNGIFSTSGNSFIYTPNGGTAVNVNTLTDNNMNYGPRATSFSGTLNGNGHKISGMYSKTTSYPSALFYSLEGTVKNLNITNMYSYTSSTSGSTFANNTSSASIIDCCASTNSFVWGARTAGGIAASLNGIIINSYNTSRVELIQKCTNYFCGSSFIGGLAGANYGYIINSYNKGTVVGGCRTGGIIGYEGWETSTPTVLNCYNGGSVTGSTSGVGYGVGWLQGGTISYTHGLNTYNTKVIGGIEYTASMYYSNNTTFALSGVSGVISNMNSWITNNNNVYRGITLQTWKPDTNNTNGGLPLLNWQ